MNRFVYGALGAVGLAWWLRGNATTTQLGASVDLDPVIENTVFHEAGGRWDVVNANARPPGIAYSGIQWTQQSGHLGRVLAAMRAVDPRTFDAVVYPNAAALLDVTARGALEPVGGLYLYNPVWVAKLMALARHPPFLAVLKNEARTGVHMQQAKKAAKMVGVETQRGLALAFDNSVRQGEYGIVRTAAALASSWGDAPPPYAERLRRFANVLNAASGAADVSRRIAATISNPALSDNHTSNIT